MNVTLDYELIEGIKARLRRVQDAVLSAHVFDKLKERPVTEEQIRAALQNPSNLMYVEAQKDNIGEKYKLVFRKSGKYDLVVIIRFLNSHLKVVTVRIQNKKRIRITGRWQKHLRHPR